MALISGPTIGTAISDPKNELERIVQEFPDDKQLAEEVFLRAIGRPPVEAELAAFLETTDLIKEDHKELVAQLEVSEAEWKTRRVELEAKREKNLAKTIEKIAARNEEIKPERERLEKERTEKIAAAEAAVAKAKKKIGEKADKWAEDHKPSAEWFPLTAASTASTNKAVLTPQADRSIAASGNADKGVYTVTVKTSLKNITGFRLEALSDPKLPSKGPGLAPNGNFVLTEFEIFAAAAEKPQESAKVKIASGIADFLQGGFAINQTFNGQTRSQQGWAVAGATGVEHWATYKLAKPIENDGGTVLTFKMHQFHNAAKHTLGRFRISATTSQGEIPLGQPESIAAVLATPKASRTDEVRKPLIDYLAVTDPEIQKTNAELATAKAAVPADTMLVAMEKRKEELSKPTPDDSTLVQLREDAKQSTKQLENIRLTATEDLTWALINSPAFLFNH